MEIKALPGRRGVPRHRRPRHHLRPLHNSVINTGTAAARRLPAGRELRQRRVHPGAPHRHPRRRQAAPHLRVRARRRRARLGAAKTERQARAERDIPESERDYFLEEKYPGYGNLVPRDIARREIFHRASTRGAASSTQDRQERERGLPRPHATMPTRRCSRKKLAGILEIYEKFVGEIPYENPMQVFPRCTTRWAACGSTSSATHGLARDGLAAQPRDQHPRALRRGRSRLPVPRRQSPRRQLAALVHLRRHGRRAGDGVAIGKNARDRARSTCRRRSSRRPRSASRRSTSASSAEQDENGERRTCSTRSSAR